MASVRHGHDHIRALRFESYNYRELPEHLVSPTCRGSVPSASFMPVVRPFRPASRPSPLGASHRHPISAIAASPTTGRDSMSKDFVRDN